MTGLPIDDVSLALPDVYCRICIGGCKINLGHVFAGQNVGIREVPRRSGW